MTSVRPAAVAGMFYPGDPGALSEELDELLGTVGSFGPRLDFPKALIVPHAGYVYSGPTAAHAYDELAAGRGIVRRVVLLGPAHRVAVRGLALPTAEAFATPLGRVTLDRDALRALEGLPQVLASDAAHALEHSLEVQLPFLQKALGSFTLVPLAVGTASVAEVAAVLELLWGGRETLIVVSTDLSHYHSHGEARRIDAATLAKIAGFATDIDHDAACGATPLNGLLAVASSKGLGIRLLHACNSGDTAGDRLRVVGYSAFALHEREAVSRDEAGAELLGIARASIESSLLGTRSPETGRFDWLQQAGATFVTLTRDGALRGCIGSLEAVRPLGADVAANAVAAAFRDPRFAALTREEWPRCRAEVSLLSTPKRLCFGDEAQLLAQISAGEDGLILEAEGRRGTFLPQVWQSLPDKPAFLRELLRKAGLPADTRLARCRLWRYRVTKWTQ
jgi:hypothetical protein